MTALSPSQSSRQRGQWSSVFTFLCLSMFTYLSVALSLLISFNHLMHKASVWPLARGYIVPVGPAEDGPNESEWAKWGKLLKLLCPPFERTGYCFVLQILITLHRSRPSKTYLETLPKMYMFQFLGSTSRATGLLTQCSAALAVIWHLLPAPPADLTQQPGLVQLWAFEIILLYPGRINWYSWSTPIWSVSHL